jgi:hypothetical protein
MTSQFTTATPALYVEGWNIFKVGENIFLNALGYPWHCNFFTTLALYLMIVGLAPGPNPRTSDIQRQRCKNLQRHG